MDIECAKSELRNPPKVGWLTMTAEIGLFLVIGIALSKLMGA